MKQVTIDKKTGRVRVCTINNEPDMAQQQYKDSCDVNNIMKKYEQSGEITHIAKGQGRYADLGEPADLMDAKMRVIRAESAFMTLPAEVRAACDHDPANFLKMINEHNELLVKYKILDPKKAEAGKPDPQASGSAPGSEKK